MLSNFPNDPRLRPASEDFVEAKVDALGLRLIMWMVGIAVAVSAVLVAAIGILI
jgi:hypothetical protein